MIQDFLFHVGMKEVSLIVCGDVKGHFKAHAATRPLGVQKALENKAN